MQRWEEPVGVGCARSAEGEADHQEEGLVAVIALVTAGARGARTQGYTCIATGLVVSGIGRHTLYSLAS